MRVDIGFVAEIAWMPRLYDTRFRDGFDDGEPVERLWQRHGWDPSTTATVVFGASR